MSDQIYAPSFPLDFDNQYGFKNVENLQEVVRFHLTNLLLTSPGEKIAVPHYGVGVRRYLFEQAGTGFSDDLRVRIVDQVSIYLSYLTLSLVETEFTDDNTLQVRVGYSIEELDVSDVLLIEIPIGDYTSPQTLGGYQ